MSKNVIVAYDAVNAKVYQPINDVKLLIQSALSYQVAGAEQSLAFKQHRWDGRSTFFQWKTASFPAGFVHLVSAKLKKHGYTVQLVRKPLPEPLGDENPKVGEFEPRDYQTETVNKLLKHGQIIAQLSTGAGKSLVARLAFARINRPTLFLTTRSVLMYQMKESFEKDLGQRCSVLGDGQFGHIDENGKMSISKMSVGMVQTLISKLSEPSIEAEFDALFEPYSKKKLSNQQVEQICKQLKPKAEAKYKEKALERQKVIKLLSMFEFVILEEAHEASGNSYYEILKHCKNAHYRLALTGTPFMKENEEANMRLMACSGPIAIKVSEKQLIDRNILAKPYFKIVQLHEKPLRLFRTTGWQSAYRLGITENKERNEAIVREVWRATQYGLTAMVLVQHTKHGEHLFNMFQEKNIKVDFIRGENDQTRRKQALNALSNGSTQVLIGTTILDVGVDVPAVGMIVLAGGGKAEVALRQRIGRGLRAKKQGPNVAFVIDFSDHFNNHTKAHAVQRLDIIKNTEGFGENIVNDFDYEALGFRRVNA